MLDLAPLSREEPSINPYIKFQDQYSFERLIGQGTYGSVYKAIHKVTGEVSAIKVVQKSSERRKNDMLKGEMNISSYIDHPNIVGTKEIYADDQNVYFVMKYMGFGSIGSLIAQKQIALIPLIERDCSFVIRKILEAVVYLHETGVVHRDIKPDNVLVGGSISEPIFALSDFGLSASFFGKNYLSRMTMVEKVGTPAFAAPELLSGKIYDEKVDIWSIGVTTFFIMTGNLPFEDLHILFDPDDIPSDWINLPRIKNLLRSASPLLISFLQSLMNLDPTKRLSARACMEHEWIRNHMIETKNSGGSVREVFSSSYNCGLESLWKRKALQSMHLAKKSSCHTFFRGWGPNHARSKRLLTAASRKGGNQGDYSLPKRRWKQAIQTVIFSNRLRKLAFLGTLSNPTITLISSE